MRINEADERALTAGGIARLIIVVFVGLILIVAGGWLGYQSIFVKKTIKDDNFTIKQSISHEVEYADNSFFDSSPAPVTNAYVADIVNRLTARFRYEYKASADADIEYTYHVTASVRAVHRQPSNGSGASVVWNREYQLVEPTTKTVNGDTFVIDTPATVPYREYRDVIKQFDTTLNVGTSGEVLVTLHVNLKGMSDGEAFSDTKTSSLVAPLTQPILTTDTTYEKDSVASMVGEEQESGLLVTAQKFYGLGGLLLVIAGVGVLVLAGRSKISKSDYERELEKIYRYHDGIIIRSATVPSFGSKQRIAVEKFSDLLNIEEELKSPIVACRLGEEGTLFLIVSHEVVYQFTLGRPPETIPDILLKEDTTSVKSVTRRPRIQKKQTKKRVKIQ